MCLTITAQCKRDMRRAQRRGKDLGKFQDVVKELLAQRPLDVRHRPHRLSGAMSGYWECHIEPDWLLIWDPTDGDELILLRTGSHADLFD